MILVLSLMQGTAQNPCEEGAAAARQRNLENAEALLAKCVQGDSGLQHFLLLAAVYQNQQRPEALYQLALRGLERFPAERRFYLVVATHDGRSGNYRHAIETTEAALKRWPGDAQLESLLANAQFSFGKKMLDGGDSAHAIPHLRRAMELAPEDTETRMNLGRALHNEHQRTEAFAIFDELVRSQPSQPLVHFHRAMSYYSLGDFEAAIADASRELELQPGDAPSHLLRGLAHMALGDWEKAEADLSLAAAKMPKNSQAQFGFARVLVEREEWKRAEAQLQKTIALDPTDPGPVNTLIRMLLRQGRHDEAAALRPKAVALSRERRSAAPGEIRFQDVRPHTP